MSTRRGFPEPLPPEKGQGGAFRTVLWETYPHPRGKNGRGHISHVRIQKKRLSQNETAFFCVCKKIGQVLTSLSQNLPVSLIFCILGNQVKISQR